MPREEGRFGARSHEATKPRSRKAFSPKDEHHETIWTKESSCMQTRMPELCDVDFLWHLPGALTSPNTRCSPTSGSGPMVNAWSDTVGCFFFEGEQTNVCNCFMGTRMVSNMIRLSWAVQFLGLDGVTLMSVCMEAPLQSARYIQYDSIQSEADVLQLILRTNTTSLEFTEFRSLAYCFWGVIFCTS